jgi:hypothetical protein
MMMDQDLTALLLAEAEAILASDPSLQKMAHEVSIEAAGNTLGRRVEPSVENVTGTTPAWDRLKVELYSFFCTRDAKYAPLRKQLADAKKSTQNYAVPALAATLGKLLGIAVGVLTPFVALAVAGIIEVGVNAWCAGKKGDVPKLSGKKKMVQL